MIGHGSFGVVFQAKVVETNEVVAIKKVLQDRRFKNRELQILVYFIRPRLRLQITGATGTQMVKNTDINICCAV